MSPPLPFPAMLSSIGDLPVVEPQSLAFYLRDFQTDQELPRFKDEPIIVRREPHPANTTREYTYWHMVTEGERGEEDERKRTPDLKRMVRIPWANPLLVHYMHEAVKRWWNVRKGLRHYCLWHPKVNYLLIVKERPEGHYLVTSYCPTPLRVAEFHMELAEAKRAGHTF